MKAIERVKTILSFKEADRVPWDLWATQEVIDLLCKKLNLPDGEALLRYLDVDFRYIKGPSFVGQDFKKYDDGTIEDLWGVRRQVMNIEKDGIKWSYKHVAVSPLEKFETVKEVEDYKGWPDASLWDYSNVKNECLKFKDFVVVNAGDRLDRTAQLKPMMYIRGVEQCLVDLYTNPEIAECIIEHIKHYFMEYNKKVFAAAEGNISIFMMGDDFGTQHGQMMSLDIWRKFFKEGFKKYIELAHKNGMKVMHHTCGSVRAFIPEFIECGLDILQSVQPRANDMNLKDLKREFGKHIAFHGSMDIQLTIPKGTKEQIFEEVRERMEAGKPGGGFIISTAHNILPDTPVDNVLALFEAYKKYGNY